MTDELLMINKSNEFLFAILKLIQMHQNKIYLLNVWF